MRIAAALGLLTAIVLGGAASAAGLGVTGVADNDTLNLHAAPDAKSAKTGQLQPHDTDIAVVAVDSKGVDWVKVQKGNQSGWANTKFLQYDTTQPVHLACSGSEPFWNMSVGYGFAIFEYDGKTSKIPLDPPKSPAVASSPWLLTVHGKPGLFLLADTPENKCGSDSGETSPYSMVVNAGGIFAQGCCN